MNFLMFTGCNLTGGIDNSKSNRDKVLDAQAKMDTGDCQAAVDLLKDLSPKDDRALQILGTAYLCTAGADANRVTSALGGYDSSSNNLNVVGALATRLITPATDADERIVSALTAFGEMSTSKQKALWQIYGNVVRIASLMAKTSADKVAVRRTDIAPAACVSQTCSTAPAQCSAGMTDADALVAANALTAANTAKQLVDLGSIGNLAGNLNTALGNSLTANAARCVLVNQTLSN